jgi:hypothetical protein
MSNPKTYAWNFREVTGDALVLRAISQDSIGVLKLVDGQFEFWHLGKCCIRTKSFAVLFRGIDKIERNS